METFSKNDMVSGYIVEKQSVSSLAKRYGCSQNKINYWLAKYKIQKRSIAEAVYQKKNPNGDPFTIHAPNSKEEAFLFGLGLGLFWGEGNKKNKDSVRLGNTDPALIIRFIEFLKIFYTIHPTKMRFGLQVFNDMSAKKAINFWIRTLRVSRKQFFKVTITPSRSIGTYKEKSKYGVLTVYVGNKKLRNIISAEIEKLQSLR